jgi:hypothetical protein
MKNKVVTFIITIASVLAITAFAGGAETTSEWLSYDDDTATNSNSSFKFQGVRFSLPDDVVKAQLLTVSFYYSGPGACPVTIHVTSFDHRTELITPIDYSAGNEWNDVDLSADNLLVPHNFYVILESYNCGSPVMDDDESYGRSFKGQFLQSLNSPLPHNLLIRSEIGPSISIPVAREWDMNITEKVKTKMKGQKPEIDRSDYTETWTLFDDGSFQTDNELYGAWKQKRSKFAFSLDPEDIGELIAYNFPAEVTSVLVTKIAFTGTEKRNGTIKGKCKIYASVHFLDDNWENSIATVIIEKNFIHRINP